MMKAFRFLPITLSLLLALACSPPRANWQQSDVEGPPGRFFAASAFDSGRQRAVVFGGILAGNALSAETWEYDGREWTLRDEGTGPTARSRAAMAYDPAGDETLVFGGYDDAMAFDDAWAWNGAAWRYVETIGPRPAPRFNAALTPDPAGNGLILFGGTNGATLYDDTWRWDGNSWRQLNIDGPSRRHGHAMVADPARERIVLFGGLEYVPTDAPPGTAPENGETWAFRDGGWQRLTSSGPGPRGFARLAREQVEDRILLYGGSGGENPLADLWQLDDDRWRAVAVSGTAPAPRYSPVFTTSPDPMTLVLFGGSHQELHEDTWTLRVAN